MSVSGSELTSVSAVPVSGATGNLLAAPPLEIVQTEINERMAVGSEITAEGRQECLGTSLVGKRTVQAAPSSCPARDSLLIIDGAECKKRALE